MKVAEATCGCCNKKPGSNLFVVAVAKQGKTGFEKQEGRFVRYPLANKERPALVSSAIDRKKGIDFFFTVCDPKDSPDCAQELKATLEKEGFQIVQISETVLVRQIPLKVTMCLV